MKIKENTLSISKNTFDILRNFYTINSSIIINKGNKISTISLLDNAFAEAVIEETFPQNFAIYDLHQFLQSVSLMPDHTIIFDNDKYLKIKSGRSTIKYFFSDPSLIKTPPEKINFPEADISFSISLRELTSLKRASNLHELPDLSIIGDGSNITLVVGNKNNETANTFSIVVGQTDKTFSYNMKVENINVLDADYTVSISSQLISKFQHDKLDLKYYIALES
jgi:hypothetical protein